MRITVLPPNFLKCMEPAQREAIGKAGVLPKEAQAKADQRREKELQRDCEQYLNLKNVFYLIMPYGRKTRVRKGWPDLAIWFEGGQSILVELKACHGQISPDQYYLHAEFHVKTGRVVHIINNFTDFAALIKEGLQL